MLLYLLLGAAAYWLATRAASDDGVPAGGPQLADDEAPELGVDQNGNLVIVAVPRGPQFPWLPPPTRGGPSLAPPSAWNPQAPYASASVGWLPWSAVVEPVAVGYAPGDMRAPGACGTTGAPLPGDPRFWYDPTGPGGVRGPAWGDDLTPPMIDGDGDGCAPGKSCCAECAAGGVGSAVPQSAIDSGCAALVRRIAAGDADARARACRILELAMGEGTLQDRHVGSCLAVALDRYRRTGAAGWVL